MFMLGTNDITRGHSTSEITAAYTKIVQTVRASNPKAKFIVSILPRWWSVGGDFMEVLCPATYSHPR
jgi:lysophospholipase L1-like esterase